jgi:hypothetical protein
MSGGPLKVLKYCRIKKGYSKNVKASQNREMEALVPAEAHIGGPFHPSWISGPIRRTGWHTSAHTQKRQSLARPEDNGVGPKTSSSSRDASSKARNELMHDPFRTQSSRIARPGWGSCYACLLTVHSGRSK